ncbi:acyl-CoA thioester hydrolase/BAAT C-terminal domain-containing protein [Flagellimonas meishanensis]|uniref:acyl-CoA thioester hydrolase/BAAT C-terminal domain-containing protein n=1 Tax=Flagellimonas meishanensis TaxID=2873264 RepID=UPI001CA61B51|nr:acyl-CoA thioester hydrolase/BAAT C-terminal domain-containing protein [[Muricauda] meishanensis]
MENKKMLWIVLFIFGACQQPPENENQEAFTSFLDYGEHPVGFKTLFVSDLSRKNVPYADWGGKLYPKNVESAGRNLPLHIWYPAEENDQELLPFHHFARLNTVETENQFLNQNDSFYKQVFSYQVRELGGGKDFGPEQMDALLGLKTNASLNSTALQQKFPLVIFPNGSSPAFQSILCELLASHGYIVAGVSLKGQFSHPIDASVLGLEVAVDDLEFALQELLKLPNVDQNKIALMGNAIESSFCAALASRNEKIEALISLEGGFLSQFEQDILNETSFYQPQNITIPIMAIYAPHPSISPHFIYDLTYSERYFAHFPGMTEFHLLNFGVFEEYIPNIIGEPKGDTKMGFKITSDLVLAFLDAKLKSKSEKLDQFYSGGIPKSLEKTVDTLFRLDGFNPPPNMAVLKNLFVANGMSAIDSIYQSHISEGNAKPFSNTFYNDFKNWLAWKKDPDYVNRMRLYEMAVESYPESALNHYRLGYYFEKNNFIEKSQSHYRQAKILLEQDNTLSPPLKKDLEMELTEAFN